MENTPPRPPDNFDKLLADSKRNVEEAKNSNAEFRNSPSNRFSRRQTMTTSPVKTSSIAGGKRRTKKKCGGKKHKKSKTSKKRGHKKSKTHKKRGHKKRA